jgi:hypothetical protein
MRGARSEDERLFMKTPIQCQNCQKSKGVSAYCKDDNQRDKAAFLFGQNR